MKSLLIPFIVRSFGPQDDASPAALTDLCLTFLSQDLERFCATRPDGSLSFRDAVLFPQELADQLLAKMATEGKRGAQGAPLNGPSVDNVKNENTHQQNC